MPIYSARMEIRLLIAYGLIALMIAAAIIVIARVRDKKKRERERLHRRYSDPEIRRQVQ